jgi:hypothetical protein
MTTSDTSGVTAASVVMPYLPPTLKPLSEFELWPSYVFYAPIAIYWLWLAVRFRSLALPALANPLFENGGICGASKATLLAQIGGPSRSLVANFIKIETSKNPTADLCKLVTLMSRRLLSFPIVTKPDLGRHGMGVRRICGISDLRRYLTEFPSDSGLIIQELVPGEGEAGVFYIRRPFKRRGHIPSLTLKYAPFVVGNGKSTIKELIKSDPRARYLAHKYFARGDVDFKRVLHDNEVYPLLFARGHGVGAIFRDGGRFITPKLEECFDRIARDIPEFYFGRFDVRFERFEKFIQGEDFKIVEINGSMSEPTHIWDAAMTLREARRTVRKFIREAFEIGAIIRMQGRRSPSVVALVKALFREFGLFKRYPHPN